MLPFVLPVSGVVALVAPVAEKLVALAVERLSVVGKDIEHAERCWRVATIPNLSPQPDRLEAASNLRAL